MNYWKLKLMKNSIFNKILFIFLFIINFEVFAKDFIIQGNQFTDDDIVLSIIGDIPDIDDESQSNFILKKLISSNFFESVEVSYDLNNYIIKINEYPAINKFYFENNERLKDEDIDNIIKELDFNTLSKLKKLIKLILMAIQYLIKTYFYQKLNLKQKKLQTFWPIITLKFFN